MPLLPQVRRFAAVALATAYPLFAHGASVLESRALTLVSVAILTAAILFRPVTEGRLWAWMAVPLAVLAIVVLWQLDAVSLVLFLPPVALNAFLAWLFGHTLALGSRPLIERLVRLLQPPGEPPEPAVIRYAGHLTQIWTALFVLLAAANLVLAACTTPGGLLESAGMRVPFAVSRETWSLFANVLNYAIVAAFFVLEYVYRRRRFPNRPYRGFTDFLRRAAAAGPALAATLEPVPVVTIEVPARHPAYAGHFPGRPLLPGVMLLERVIDEGEKLVGRPLTVLAIPWVKFLAPLSPGDRATIRFRHEHGTLYFEVLREMQRVAQGVIRIGSGGKPG